MQAGRPSGLTVSALVSSAGPPDAAFLSPLDGAVVPEAGQQGRRPPDAGYRMVRGTDPEQPPLFGGHGAPQARRRHGAGARPQTRHCQQPAVHGRCRGVGGSSRMDVGPHCPLQRRKGRQVGESQKGLPVVAVPQAFHEGLVERLLRPLFLDKTAEVGGLPPEPGVTGPVQQFAGLVGGFRPWYAVPRQNRPQVEGLGVVVGLRLHLQQARQ